MMTQNADAGRPPAPHWCDHSTQTFGDQGCPNWPACLSVTDMAAAKRADRSQLGRDLATLAGWAAGAVLIMVVAAILLPLVI
jgi:hypothetical protein